MRQYLEEIIDNQSFTLDLIVVDKTPSENTKGESKMVVLEVADKTKVIKARFFGSDLDCNEFYNQIQVKQVYQFSGVYSIQYNGFIIDKNKMILVTEPDWNDFNLQIDVNNNQSETLFKYIDQIQDDNIKQLLKLIFEDDVILKKFLTFPAAIIHHHAFPNGLITHVLEMLKIAESILTLYSKVDKDILFCGCILHDIGKITEFQVEYGTKYSDEGQLLSHIPIAYSMISDKISQIEKFPHVLKNEILHMILSHHGKSSWDKPSFMEPKTLEALALHHIDMLSAKLSPVHDFAEEYEGWQKISNGRYLMKKDHSSQQD